MNNLHYIILFFCFLAFFNINTEKLRIYGSHDIRGDPEIPFNPFISPWNVGTSFPIRNRRLINY